MSALIDGLDIIVVEVPSPVAEGTVRALAARARQKGAVLVPTTAWPGSDLVIEVTDRTWTGLGAGRGRLRRQELTLRAAGRGRSAQPRTATVTLPPPSLTGPEPDRRIPPPPPLVLNTTDTPAAVDGWAATGPQQLHPVPRPVDRWEHIASEVVPPARQKRRS